MNVPPRHPKDLSPKIADDLAVLLVKSTAREPSDRFAERE